jgi:hypothetical protein
MTDPRLTVGSDGRVRGNASISYNKPFPTHDGSWGSGAMNGVVMHTEVGFEHAVIDEFNNIASQASAHFSVGIDGHVHQYGPIGKGWIAWCQEAGNDTWYSIEHEDQGHPDTPLTGYQIQASAQLLECLSNFAGFPLKEANSVTERGYGVHYMGGAAWGGHTCPDVPPKHIRSNQRPDIIALAKTIRAWKPPVPVPVTPVIKFVTCNGKVSLQDVAHNYRNRPFMVILRTFGNLNVQRGLLRYISTRRWSTPVPEGIVLAVEVLK